MYSLEMGQEYSWCLPNADCILQTADCRPQTADQFNLNVKVGWDREYLIKVESANHPLRGIGVEGSLGSAVCEVHCQ